VIKSDRSVRAVAKEDKTNSPKRVSDYITGCLIRSRKKYSEIMLNELLTSLTPLALKI
jgi:hypothetical protein